MHITRWKAVLVGVVALAVIVPAAAFAATSVFDDVADDSVYVNDINWLAASGVTKGCNPPANTRFCPGSNVTREQMAAFMHRLASNKVVDAATAVEADNADTLDGKDSTSFLSSMEKAADSDKLDGKDSTAFLGKTSKAADSDQLDGLSSEAFLQHGDIVLSQSTSELTRYGAGPSTITYINGGNWVSGDGSVIVNLTGPAILGGVDYGLESIEYCIQQVSGGANVWKVTINTNTPIGSPIVDTTLRTTNGCYVVAANLTGAQAYDLHFAFGGGGSLRLSGVQSTWAPADSLAPLTARQSSDGSPSSSDT